MVKGSVEWISYREHKIEQLDNRNSKILRNKKKYLWSVVYEREVISRKVRYGTAVAGSKGIPGKARNW